MLTWTFKGPLFGGALLALSACDDAQTAALFEGQGGGAASRPVALSRTEMANGAFSLVPPQGFCIDKRTLRQNFALMARCDALGAPDRAGGAPVGVITVSVTAPDGVGTLPTPEETADAAKLARISAIRSENRAVTFRAEGTPPSANLDIKHWRGTVQVGDRVMGLALYGPKGGRTVSVEGRELLNNLIRRTQENS